METRNEFHNNSNKENNGEADRLLSINDIEEADPPIMNENKCSLRTKPYCTPGFKSTEEADENTPIIDSCRLSQYFTERENCDKEKDMLTQIIAVNQLDSEIPKENDLNTIVEPYSQTKPADCIHNTEMQEVLVISKTNNFISKVLHTFSPSSSLSEHSSPLKFTTQNYPQTHPQSPFGFNTNSSKQHKSWMQSETQPESDSLTMNSPQNLVKITETEQNKSNLGNDSKKKEIIFDLTDHSALGDFYQPIGNMVHSTSTNSFDTNPVHSLINTLNNLNTMHSNGSLTVSPRIKEFLPAQNPFFATESNIIQYRQSLLEDKIKVQNRNFANRVILSPKSVNKCKNKETRAEKHENVENRKQEEDSITESVTESGEEEEEEVEGEEDGGMNMNGSNSKLTMSLNMREKQRILENIAAAVSQITKQSPVPKQSKKYESNENEEREEKQEDRRLSLRELETEEGNTEKKEDKAEDNLDNISKKMENEGMNMFMNQIDKLSEEIQQTQYKSQNNSQRSLNPEEDPQNQTSNLIYASQADSNQINSNVISESEQFDQNTILLDLEPTTNDKLLTQIPNFLIFQSQFQLTQIKVILLFC